MTAAPDFGDYASIATHLETALQEGDDSVVRLDISDAAKPLIQPITICLTQVWDNFRIVASPETQQVTARGGGAPFVHSLLDHLNAGGPEDNQEVVSRLRRAVGFLIQEALV